MQDEHVQVKGSIIDGETRCTHYNSELDVIAIKFYCCKEYYPCHLCHSEHADHSPEVWPAEKFDQHAVLCGKCGLELTVDEYMNCGSHCPSCKAGFNPGCSLHAHLYFGTV